MPSYLIYELKETINPLSVFKDFNIKTVQPMESESDAMKSKIREYQKLYRESKIVENGPGDNNFLQLKVQHHIQFEDNQTIWVNEQMTVLNYQNLVLIQKKAGGINLILDMFIKKNYKIKRRFFTKRRLFTLWNKLEPLIKSDNNEIILRRAICKYPSIYNDRIDEINISDKNLENVSLFREIRKVTEECNAITIRFNWISDEKISQTKYNTVRIDKNGSILFYGNPSKEVILKVILYLHETL